MIRKQINIKVTLAYTMDDDTWNKVNRLEHFVGIYFLDYMQWLYDYDADEIQYYLSEYQMKIKELCRKWVDKWTLSNVVQALYFYRTEIDITEIKQYKDMMEHCYRLMCYSLEERFHPNTAIRIEDVCKVDFYGRRIDGKIYDEDIPF